MKNIVLILFIASTSVFGADTCSFTQTTQLNTKIQTGQYASGECFVLISPNFTEKLIYRSHVFTDQGQHLVFNSYGPGPSSRFTGARVFNHVLENPRLAVRTSGHLIYVDLNDSLSIIVDAETSLLIDEGKGIRFQTSPDIIATNYGGIEIINAQQTYIDFGFKLGGSPLSDLMNEHIIVRPGQVDCRAINGELLEVINYDIFWKFKGFDELSQYFSEVCSV